MNLEKPQNYTNNKNKKTAENEYKKSLHQKDINKLVYRESK